MCDLTGTGFCLGPCRVKEERDLNQTEGLRSYPREGILELSFGATMGIDHVGLHLSIPNTGDSVCEGAGMRNALKPPENWM